MPNEMPASGMNRTERGLTALTVVLIGAAGIAHYVTALPRIVAFLVAAVALAAGAWAVSFSTEEIGKRTGPASAGLLQSTVGNLPEFFVVLFALEAGDATVARTALLGSVLVNALLLLGLVLLAGAHASKDGVMRFSPRLPNDTATLLMSAALMIVLLSVADSGHDPAGHHIEAISVIGAIAMICVYATWMWRYLHTATAVEISSEEEPPRLALRSSVALLVGAGIGAAFVGDWFVDALEPTIRQLHISQAFAGLVIVAIAGNAVEHAAGIYLAGKGKNDLAISIVKNSVAQVAAFLFPLMVLVSLLTATHLTFVLDPIYLVALFGTAVVVWQITGDGEATPFEGVALISIFVVIATIAAFQH